VVVAILVAALAADSRAQTVTQDEALRMAFPEPATIERRTAFLTEEQRTRAERLASEDVEIPASVVTFYTGTAPNGTALGAAYFDVHRVRTLDEVLMVVVDTTGAISRVDVLRFSEPPEYRASTGWLRTMEGHQLTDRLSTKGGIPSITGATLTAGSVIRASRRVLAIHSVIDPFGRGES
jgi:hypothetical protein